MFSIWLLPILKLINNIVVGRILSFFFMVIILSWPFMSFFYILNYYICTQFPVPNVLMLNLNLNVYEFQKYVYCLGILDSSWFCFMILIIAYSIHLILDQVNWTIDKNPFYFSQRIIASYVVLIFLVVYYVNANLTYEFGFLPTMLKSFQLKASGWKTWIDISQLHFYNELIRDNFLFLHPYLLMAFLCIIVGLFSILRSMTNFREVLSVFNMQLLLKKLYLIMFMLGFTATFYGALWAYYDFNWNGWWIWDSIEIWMYFLILYNLIFIHTTFISTMKTQVSWLLLTCYRFRQTKVTVQLLSLLQKWTNISFFSTALLFILFIKLNLFSSIHNFVIPSDYFGKLFLIYKTGILGTVMSNNILFEQIVATVWLLFVFFTLLILWTLFKNSWQYFYRRFNVPTRKMMLFKSNTETLIDYYIPIVLYTLILSFFVFFFYLVKIPFHNLLFKDFFVFSFFGLNYACNLAFVILIIILTFLKLNLAVTKNLVYIVLAFGFLFFVTNYGNYELWLVNFMIILFFSYLILTNVFRNIYTTVSGNYLYFNYPFFSKVNHYFQTHGILLIWLWLIVTSKIIVSVEPTYLNLLSSSDLSTGSFILTELKSFQFFAKLEYPLVYTNCLPELNTSLALGNMKLILNSYMNSYSWTRMELVDIYKQFKLNNLNQSTGFCWFFHEYLTPNTSLSSNATATTSLVTNGVLFRFDFFSYLGPKTEIFAWKYPTNLIILFLWLWYICKLTKKLLTTTFIQSDI